MRKTICEISGKYSYDGKQGTFTSILAVEEFERHFICVWNVEDEDKKSLGGRYYTVSKRIIPKDTDTTTFLIQYAVYAINSVRFNRVRVLTVTEWKML